MQLVRHAIDCGRAVDHRHALTLEMAKHGERKIACLAADARHYEIRFIECLAGMDCRPAPVRVNDQLEFPRPQHRKRDAHARSGRSEEHTSELQSLMRTSYAVICLKQKQQTH